MTDPFPFDNAVDLLEADHKLVESMFLEYDALCEEGASDEVRQTLAERICREIAIHAQIEEEIFYPAVREALDDDELIEEALEQHAEAKELIGYIRAMEPSSYDYDATVKALAEAIDEHVLEEREEIFAQAKFVPLDLRALATALQLRKKQLKAAAESTGLGERPTEAALERAPPRARARGRAEQGSSLSRPANAASVASPARRSDESEPGALGKRRLHPPREQHAGERRSLRRELGIEPGMKVLDLGCGDGTTALPAAQRGADVLGVDIARNLVEAGNRRAQAAGLANLRFQEGDACDLQPAGRRQLRPRGQRLRRHVRAQAVRGGQGDGARHAARRPHRHGQLDPGRSDAGGADPEDQLRLFAAAARRLRQPDDLGRGEQRARALRGGRRSRRTRSPACATPSPSTSPARPAEFVDAFRDYYGPTMNAFEAAGKSGRAEALQAELEALFDEPEPERARRSHHHSGDLPARDGRGALAPGLARRVPAGQRLRLHRHQRLQEALARARAAPATRTRRPGAPGRCGRGRTPRSGCRRFWNRPASVPKATSVVALGLGQALREQHRRIVGAGQEGRHLADRLEADAGLGRHRAHRRLERWRRRPRTSPCIAATSAAGQVAELVVEAAVLGHDVVGDAALDDADRAGACRARRSPS